MKFFMTLLAAAGLASANTVTFLSQDSTDRTVYFTANPGYDSIDAATVPGNTNVTVTFPTGWIGNFYSVSDGSENTAGMLGEISWNSWGDLSFFDVSAIVNPADVNGVKQMWPTSGGSPVSGCTCFPCDDAYYQSDDVQTKSTSESDLFCSLGGGNTENTKYVARRDLEEDSPRFVRDFALGKWSRPRKL